MTTTLEAPIRTQASPRVTSDKSGVSARGVLRSEWVKMRSVRSSPATLAGAAGLVFAFGVLVAGSVGGIWASPGNEPLPADSATAILQGVPIAQLIIGVLGVLLITTEYATGSIRSTLTAVPARLPVLWSKATVLTAVVLPTLLVTMLATFAVGQALIGTGDVPTASLGDEGVLRAVLGSAGYLTGIALIGLALGTLLRSTAAAISTLVALVFLLPNLAGLAMPASWRDDVLQWLPSTAGDAFISVTPPVEVLSPQVGGIVFVGWVVGFLAAAAVALKRRSA